MDLLFVFNVIVCWKDPMFLDKFRMMMASFHSLYKVYEDLLIVPVPSNIL